MLGKVYLVGAGPGDPELLTVKARRLLAEADAVYYDRLVNRKLLAATRPECRCVYVGKEDRRHLLAQSEINDHLAAAAEAGEMVVRLKGGDPFVFGRGGEELLFLAARGIPCEVVPGVSSCLAVPAAAHIPVTHRELASSVLVATGHGANDADPPLPWPALVAADTLVFLMAVSQRQHLARGLLAHGRRAADPVAFIERGCTPEQRVITGTLGELAEAPPEVRAPAILVIGPVVRVREQLLALVAETAG